jgi:hypothetical protein
LGSFSSSLSSIFLSCFKVLISLACWNNFK